MKFFWGGLKTIIYLRIYEKGDTYEYKIKHRYDK